MKKHLGIVLLVLLTAFSKTIHAQKAPALCNPNASKEAKALFNYLNDMYGKKILSGQMWVSWGTDELKYIKDVTGKQPALRGMDFINNRDNDAEVQFAIDWWKGGGIPTIMWHWGAPGIGEGYENSKKPVSIDSIFIEGTVQNRSFWKELETKANLLEKINKVNVPILWRPFHELNGNWFWWGKQGPEKFKKLWTTVYDYLVKKRKLNNLIWVLCYTGQPDAAWFPGKEYVDIAGADTYNVGDSPQTAMFQKVKNIVGDKMPVTYHECGTPPNPDSCLKSGTLWSWWMEWHTSHLQKVDKDYLKYVYNHDLIITLDEVPDIMKQYGTKNKIK
ncbi:MAG: glycosyl hydrolase [Chitinophagaceae bacterium]